MSYNYLKYAEHKFEGFYMGMSLDNALIHYTKV